MKDINIIPPNRRNSDNKRNENGGENRLQCFAIIKNDEIINQMAAFTLWPGSIAAFYDCFNISEYLKCLIPC